MKQKCNEDDNNNNYDINSKAASNEWIWVECECVCDEHVLLLLYRSLWDRICSWNKAKTKHKRCICFYVWQKQKLWLRCQNTNYLLFYHHCTYIYIYSIFVQLVGLPAKLNVCQSSAVFRCNSRPSRKPQRIEGIARGWYYMHLLTYTYSMSGRIQKETTATQAKFSLNLINAVQVQYHNYRYVCEWVGSHYHHAIVALDVILYTIMPLLWR